jgi:hypothetical protein
MFLASYRHFVSLSRGIASRLLAITIALSFFAMLVPVASASLDKSGVMACCIGKEAGHCDSGLAGHKPPPPPEPEPMCELTSENLDAITIVAEPSTHSHNSRRNAESSSQAVAESKAGAETKADAESNASVESASLSRPCPMNCGACTASTSRSQKRQKDIIQARTFHYAAPGALTRFEHLSCVFSSNESWTNLNPRGPPATRL